MGTLTLLILSNTLGQMGVQKIHAKVADRQGYRTRVSRTVSGLSLEVFIAQKNLHVIQ